MFVPNSFTDGVAGGTPITAATLNNLEQGVVAADITNPASAATTALAAAITAQAEPVGLSAATQSGLGTLNQLNILGTADQAKALAGSQVEYADSLTTDETWANTSAWTANVGIAFVTGSNRLYGPPSGATQSLCRAVPVSAAGRARYRTQLNTVAGGVERYFFFGWSKATAGTASAPSDIFGVGFHILQGGSTNNIITWNMGSETVQTAFTLGASYFITAGQDETQSWVEMTDATGGSVYKLSLAKTAFTPTQLAFYLSDPRGATGDSASVITGRGGNATHPQWSNLNYDAVTTCGMTGYDSTPTPINVLTPANYDSRKPAPLVLYCHGWGGTEMSMTTAFSTNAYTIAQSLLANGFIVATSYQTGPSEAGTGYPSIANLYKYVRDHYAIGPVIVMSESFGGVAGLLTVAKRTVPNIVGWLGWYPVTNLASIYANNPTLKTGIDGAYNIPAGGTYAVQTAGYDPNLYAGSAFRGMRMRAYASAGDTAVLASANAQTFIATVTPYAVEATYVVTTGNHGDASNFQVADTLAFVNRCIGK